MAKVICVVFAGQCTLKSGEVKTKTNNMAQYRKKPVEIEAYQWDGTEFTKDLLLEWSDYNVVVVNSQLYPDVNSQLYPDKLYINTLEGRMEASIGDYIIRGVKGEYYPCKPDIFEASYEIVKE